MSPGECRTVKQWSTDGGDVLPRVRPRLFDRCGPGEWCDAAVGLADSGTVVAMPSCARLHAPRR